MQPELMLRFVLDYDRQVIHDGDWLMVECKTYQIENSGQASREAARQLYRLEGGWQACPWCIPYRTPGAWPDVFSE